MAEPLSFVASVIAVASLAGTVTTKGYRYLKAVKDCPSEVRSLMVETNILCGILSRLVVLLQDEGINANSQHHEGEDTDADHERDEADIGSLGIGEDAEAAHSDSKNSHRFSMGSRTYLFIPALDTPEFIYECQRTLLEIEGILKTFGRSSTYSTQPSANTRPRRLEAKDLKWPLKRSKTMQLIEALERHKSTCALALAENGLIGVHSVLEQTKLSNNYLAELRVKQEKLLELNITSEQST